jgi:hypothetical protein
MLPESMNVEDIKRRAWHEDRIIVINLDEDKMDAIERETFRQWADRRYPKGSS